LLFEERRWRRLLPVALVLLALVSGEGMTRVENWMDRGLAGDDAEEWTICRKIANDIAPKQTTRAAYCVQVWAHALKFRPFDERSKIGLEWDWLLRYDFGVRNSLTCPEGVSPTATFEIHEKNLPVKFVGNLYNEAIFWESRRYYVYARRNR